MSPRRRANALPAVLALAGAVTLAPAHAAPPPAPIVTGAVTVTAFFADSVTPARPPAVRLEIRHGRDCWQADTSPFGMHSTGETIRHLGQCIGWKGRYLFVRIECGGGNAWKCEQELVFARRGHRIVPLGRLARWPGGIGTSYHRGHFHDYDVDWEINDVTPHAGAPGFPLVLRDDGSALVVDLGRSWRAAWPTFRQNDSTWRALRDSSASRDVRSRRTSALFGNAVIAAYFRRPAEAVEAMEEARRTLDPETVRKMRAAVDAIRPGALPRGSRPDLPRCDAEE